MARPRADYTTQRLKLATAGGSADSERIELALEPIPAGWFMMGERHGEYADEDPDEDPPVKVSFSSALCALTEDQDLAFYLGRFPVTQGQFDCWRETEAYSRWLQSPAAKELKGEKQSYDEDFSACAEAPADSVSWYEAAAYCNWLNSQADAFGIPKGFFARLPTESEWEYACRAGTDTEHYSGDGSAALATAGWYGDNSEGTTQIVGEKEASDWGLHDMHGNVCEWCSDEWNGTAYRECSTRQSYQPVNLEDVSDAAHRVLRGASCLNSAAFCRSAIRGGFGPSNRIRRVGFRVGLFPVSGLQQPENGAGAGAGQDEAAERAQSGPDTAPAEPPLDLGDETFL